MLTGNRILGIVMRAIARPAERFAAWARGNWPADSELWLDLVFNDPDRGAFAMGFDQWVAAGRPRSEVSRRRLRAEACDDQ